jgi:radical SAM protein with 4Fe4S-binding SPASM domain
MDKFRIDGHKLIYHVPRVSKWLEGEDIYPIYVEIAPSGACNHRCTYCAVDFMEYKSTLLDADILKARLTEMARLGIKSVMYAGEGEPFLHKRIGEIIVHTRDVGIDVAITSNGVLFTKKLAEEALSSITWIKISINAGTKDTYAKVHRTDPRDFDTVIANITEAVKIRTAKKLKTAIGMQMILLPENVAEAVTLARKARDIGADYLVIKPYSQHPMSITKEYEGLKYDDHYKLGEELSKLSTDKFNVIFRARTMKKLEAAERRYRRCHALPFWSYIDASGNLWACSAYLGDDQFNLGNVMDDGFEKVWKSEKRKALMAYVAEKLDTEECRVNCRMDEVNGYLWELKNLPEHVNFI